MKRLWEACGRLAASASGASLRDGILIHPEGDRFSQAKRRRVIGRFDQNGDAKMLGYARSLAFALPPRLGGTLGLLEAARDAAVIVCAHTGFEDAASLARVWKGALVDRVIRADLRRISRNRIPAGRDAQIAWILGEWLRVDAWVEAQQSRDLGR